MTPEEARGMASKEYEMLFKLSAQMGKEFGTTFSQAQQRMTELQQEVNRLNQAQGDINAYQKQQAAVERTTEKLALLQRQHDRIQQEYQETGEKSSDLANKMDAKQAAIDQTTQKLEQQTQKLDQMEAELKEAGVDTAHLGQEQQRLAQELDKAADEMEDATKEADGFGGKGAAAFQAVGAALAAAGVAEGLKEIGEAYKECVDLSMEFQSTMSTVEALSGATAEEMAELNASAKELGATTKFTAGEAGEAMTYMGMAGWNAEQMLSGMPGVLNLAAASGEDLATVSDIVTDNLTAFGMAADQTARFSDVLAAAATGSNTSVSIMGETFKKAAPVAGALGYSIEDVAVATGLMANAGVKGSRAGTALSNTFTGLLEGVTLTGRAIGEVEFSALNADGTMKSFRETVEALRGQFDQLSEAEKTQNAMAIAGKQGYAGLLAVLNATDDDYNKLTDSINNCSGAAEKMAQIKMDNLAGQMTLLNSATEALKNTFGEAYQKELQWLAKIATEVTTGINDFLTKHPAVLKAIIAVTAEVAAFVAAYTAYQVVQKAVLAAQLLLNKAMLLNPWTIALAGVAALTVGLIALSEAQDKEAAEVRALTEESRGQYERLQELNAEYETAKETYGENSEEAQKLRWQVEYLTEEYEANKQTVEEYTQAHIEASQAVRDEAEAALDRLHQLENESGYSSVLVDRLKELAGQSTVTAEAQAEMSAIIKKLNDDMPDLALKLEDVLSGKVDFGVVEAFAQAKAEAELYAEAQDTLVEQLKAREKEDDKVKKAEKDLADAQADYAEKWQAYEAIWGTDNTGLSRWFSKEGKEFSAAEENLEKYTAQLEEAQKAYDAANAACDEATKVVAEYSGVVDGVTEAEQAAITTITTTVSELQTLSAAYNEAYAAAKESFEGQFGLFDKAEADMESTVAKAQEALNSQLSYWQSYNANLETLKNTGAEALGVTQEQYESLMSYVQSGTEEAAGLAASMASAIESGNTETVATLAETLTEVEQARDAAAQTVSAWTTGFDESMDEMVRKANETIDELELSDEAKEAALATMSSYADMILTEGDQAIINAKSIAAQVQAALQGAGSVSVPKIPGHAKGTDNAEPGLAWVGENGPELVLFQGGERVIPADKSAEMVRSARTLDEAPAGAAGDGGFNVALTINVSGGDAAEGVRTAGETLRSQLETMLEDYMAERERRAYR